MPRTSRALPVRPGPRQADTTRGATEAPRAGRCPARRSIGTGPSPRRRGRHASRPVPARPGRSRTRARSTWPGQGPCTASAISLPGALRRARTHAVVSDRRGSWSAGGARPSPPEMNPIVQPCSCNLPARCRRRRRQLGSEDRSRRSPASVERRKAMLQPGRCSASRSVSRTWVGSPGALATQSAISPSPGGAMFGPPTAA